MTIQETRKALFAKMDRLVSPLNDLESMLTGAADATRGIEGLPRKWASTNLVFEALERIDRNAYGICEECNGPISAKRLAAVPWAKYCIRCQELKDDLFEETRWDNAA